MNIEDLVGKRALLSLKESSLKTPSVEEYKILETSPSGQWVKLMNYNGRKFWKPIATISVVEVLKDLYTEKSPNGK